MKKIISVLLVAVLCLSLVACGGNNNASSNEGGNGGNGGSSSNAPAAKKVLRANCGFDPDTFDPQASNVLENALIVNQMYEYLYRENLNGEFAPALAESYTVSDDGLEYVFTLKDGIMFADGSPITTSDVKFSWVRALDPDNAFEYAYQLYYIKNGAAFNAGECSADDLGLEIIDEKTIKVTLENPAPYFVSLTGFTTYAIVSEKFASSVETYGADVASSLSSGPFMPTEWVKGQYVKYEKNPNYWDADSVKLDELYYYAVSESNTEIQMYETDMLDITYMGMPAATQAQYAAQGVLKSWPSLNTRYVMVNSENEVLSDPNVRKALQLALDLEPLARDVVTNCDPATGFIPEKMAAVDVPSNLFKTEGLIPTTAQVEEAQKLLAEAGYPNGEGFPTDFSIVYTTNEANKALAEAIVEMWRQNLNINVLAENLEGTVRRDRKNNGDYQFSLDGWSTDYMDPYSFLEIFKTGNAYNQSRYSNADYDAQLEIAATSNDQAERQAAMVKAEQILMADQACLPLYVSTKSFLAKDNLTGIVFSQMGSADFKCADFN